jgi:class 3 adenylate cyclase
MIRIVEDYGGTVEKNTGDGLMAYFEDGGGDPPAIGSKRAVACALTMLRTNDEGIAPVLMATRVDRIRFRIGIDYGAVTIANVGVARRFGSIVAVGTSANIASKMLAVAEPGQIVVGEDVVRQLPQDWMRFCHPLEIQTGYSYRTGDTYRFFEYTGRWTD